MCAQYAIAAHIHASSQLRHIDASDQYADRLRRSGRLDIGLHAYLCSYSIVPGDGIPPRQETAEKADDAYRTR
jgi:hypothetical protein